MTILHGDDRFYNIFSSRSGRPRRLLRCVTAGKERIEENREVGTHVMDEYPTYEEWITMFDMDTDTPDMVEAGNGSWKPSPCLGKGNAALDCKETDNLVDTEHEVQVEITFQDGKPVLATNLYEFLGDFSGSMIHSDTLGCAFEPEERFENPDGTAITFDRDYFGGHRGMRILPGPFADKTDAGKKALVKRTPKTPNGVEI